MPRALQSIGPKEGGEEGESEKGRVKSTKIVAVVVAAIPWLMVSKIAPETNCLADVSLH